MIGAERQALRARLAQEGLAIHERELDWMENSLEAVGTQAALLAGFAFEGLTITDEDLGDETQVQAIMFYGFCALSFAAEVYCVINTTFLIIWGPGLALRGPEGSMKRAVEGMLQERQHIYFSFGLGLVTLVIAAIAYTWAQVQDSRVSIPISVTAILALSMFIIAYFAWQVVQRFVLPSHNTISGFTNENNVWDEQIINAWSQSIDSNSFAQQSGLHGQKGGYVPPPALLNAQTTGSPNAKFDISGIPHQMKGTLAKQSQWSRQWQNRFYVLSGCNLYLFKSEKDPVPLRNRPIELQGYEVAYDNKSNSRVFKLIPKHEDDERRIWELRADSEEQCKQWAAQLKKALSEDENGGHGSLVGKKR